MAAASPPVYDVTARRAHQWTMLALVALGFVLGDQWGWLPLALAGAIMLLGRFWWPADVVRQLVWRLVEPAGWLPRIERTEDRATRRVARVLGGLVWLLSASLVLLGQPFVGWLLSGLIAVMVALDAALDFCALCFVVRFFDRNHSLSTAVPGEH